MPPLDLLDKILVFYIIFKNNNIVKICKKFKLEDAFLLSFDSPRIFNFKDETMLENIDKTLYFTVDIHKKKQMKGQFIQWNDYFILAFSPLVNEINDLKKYNVSFFDFPKHSVINETLLSLQVNKEIIDNRNKEIEKLKENFDITMEEMNVLNNEVLRLEKNTVLEGLISSIAHEINNPLSVIKTNNDLLKDNLKTFFNVSTTILNSLQEEEKNIFYEILDKCLSNKEKLTRKSQRYRKKLIEIEILNENLEEDRDWFVTKISDINLLPPYSIYFKKIKKENLKKILRLTEKIVNYNDSFSLISNALDKVSRTVFSLKNYNYNNSYNFLISEIGNQIQSTLEIYDSYILGKIFIQKDWSEDVGKIKVSDELIEVWKILIHNSITVPSFFRKEIKISIIKDDLNLYVEICDNGSGIKEEDKEKIFTSFFTTKGPGEGVGLGLYTAKKIVNAHDGDITFFSTIEETIFRVSLII